MAPRRASKIRYNFIFNWYSNAFDDVSFIALLKEGNFLRPKIKDIILDMLNHQRIRYITVYIFKL